MKKLHHLEEEEGTRLCLCKGFVVRIGVIVMIEEDVWEFCGEACAIFGAREYFSKRAYTAFCATAIRD
jgi:hypothetical protein